MPSAALWVPLAWLLILASRPVSTWTTGGLYLTADAYADGSPLDAGVFLALIIAAIVVLRQRHVAWSTIAVSNRYLGFFFLYCLISLLWSEFPFVSFKRWIKDFGNILMVLVVLTEKNPADAIRAMFARFTNLVVPLSVLFIKYWPDLGRYYHQFTWTPGYSGVATEKNALGVLAFVCGLYLVWDYLVYRRKNIEKHSEGGQPAASSFNATGSNPSGALRRSTYRKPAPPLNTGSEKVDLVLQVILLGMVFWLINMADSTNALLCLVLGSAGIFFTKRSAEGSQKLLNNLGKYTLLLVLAASLLFFSPGLKESILEFLGEDVTLTGRTDIWQDVLEEPNSALWGAGYQSFWLGPVTERLWVKYPFRPNQAHNAYIETYLNGGWIGVILILIVLVSGATHIKSELIKRRPESFLLAAFFFTATVYCWSEAMFGKMSPIWLILLMAMVKAPQLAEQSSKVRMANGRGQRWQPTR